MQLTQLYYFIEICRQSSLTEAATRLKVTPPALTKSLQSLEDELDTKLFVRVGGKLSITDEGQLLKKCAEEIIEKSEKAFYQLGEMGRKHERVFLNTVYPISRFSYNEILDKYLEYAGKEDIALYETTLPLALENLKKERVDGAILISSRISRQEFEVFPIRKEYVVYAMRKEHPLAGRKTLTIEDIAAYPLIMEKNSLNEETPIEREFRTCGVTPEIYMNTQQHDTALLLLRGNIGYIALENTVCGMEDILYARLDAGYSPVEIGIVTVKDKKWSIAFRKFVDFVLDYRFTY